MKKEENKKLEQKIKILNLKLIEYENKFKERDLEYQTQID
jgi:hypothetical protein